MAANPNYKPPNPKINNNPQIKNLVIFPVSLFIFFYTEGYQKVF